jgi:hypothetical protein
MKGVGLQKIHTVSDMNSFSQRATAHYIPPFFKKTRRRVYTKSIGTMT